MEAGNIQASRLIDLFKQVVESRIIVSVQVAGTTYQRLTCITGFKPEGAGYSLLIDAPKGLREALGRAGHWNLQFSFNGPDRLEYSFRTTVGRIVGDELLVPFPERVERLQRRRDFRIDAPARGRIRFESNDNKYILQMINISLGGALGSAFKHKTGNLRQTDLRPDQPVFKLVLTFPPDKGTPEQIIFISTAEVKRVEFDKEKNLFRCAFEFIEIEKEQKNKLTETVYRLQRQDLRRR